MLGRLNEIRALQDPVKQSQCEFIIQDTPGLLLAKLEQKIAGTLSGNKACASSKELRLRCTSYSYPGPKIGQTSLNIMGHRRKLGTIQNKSGVWKCKVTEDYQGSVLNVIQAWCDLIFSNMTGNRLPSILYVTSCNILLGGSSEGGNVRNSNLQRRSIHLMGFYPISYTVNAIDPSSSNPIDVDIEFNYDYYADNNYNLLSHF